MQKKQKTLIPPPPPPTGEGHGDRVVQLSDGLTMMANHKPLVCAVPLMARPKSVQVKLFKGFYDVRVQGVGGERGFYRIPMSLAGSPKVRASQALQGLLRCARPRRRW